MHPFYTSVQVLKVLLIFLMFYSSFYTSADIIFDKLLQLHSTLLSEKKILSSNFLFQRIHSTPQQCPAELSSWIITLVFPILSKIFHLPHPACCTHHVWTVLPLPPNLPFARNPVDGGENPAQKHKKCSFPTPEKFLSPNSNFHVITQYKLHL